MVDHSDQKAGVETGTGSARINDRGALVVQVPCWPQVGVEWWGCGGAPSTSKSVMIIILHLCPIHSFVLTGTLLLVHDESEVIMEHHSVILHGDCFLIRTATIWFAASWITAYGNAAVQCSVLLYCYGKETGPRYIWTLKLLETRVLSLLLYTIRCSMVLVGEDRLRSPDWPFSRYELPVDRSKLTIYWTNWL